MNNDRFLVRGQRIDTKEWVYGHYFIAGLTDDNSGTKPEDGWFFLADGKTRHCIETEGCVCVVIPETLGKYSTLKDKNEKLIFEGDILKTDCGIIAIVKYGTITHKVASKLDNGELRNVDITGFYYEVSGENCFMRNELKTSDDCTIIGNIFDKEKVNFGYSVAERKA